MDVKYVLSSVLREAEKLGASGGLIAGVRLSGAVNSERGEGYLMLYPEGLALLYRRLGHRDYEGCFADLLDWSFDNYREEKYALALTVSVHENVFNLEFTPSERESAEVILNALVQAQAEPQALYSESLLIMAGVFFLLAHDGHEDYARNLLGKQLWMAGKRYAADRTLAELVRQGNQLFSQEQKQSLLLNLIELRLSDDQWSTAEEDAMKELAAVWQLPEGFFEQSRSMFLLRSRIWEFFGN